MSRRFEFLTPARRIVVQVMEQEAELSAACVVCCTERKEVVMLPCRHFCTCSRCSAALVTCPMCRAAVQSCLTVYH